MSHQLPRVQGGQAKSRKNKAGKRETGGLGKIFTETSSGLTLQGFDVVVTSCFL